MMSWQRQQCCPPTRRWYQRCRKGRRSNTIWSAERLSRRAAAADDLIELGRAPERESHVVHVHERMLARHLSVALRLSVRLVLRLVAADQPLLLGLVVAALEEDREQFEGVAVGPRGAAGAFVDAIQLVPAPGVVWFERRAMHLALDDRRIDDTFLWAADDAADFLGTAATHDLDGVLPIGAEAQRPEQPSGRHFGIHFAVGSAVLDLQL